MRLGMLFPEIARQSGTSGGVCVLLFFVSFFLWGGGGSSGVWVLGGGGGIAAGIRMSMQAGSGFYVRTKARAWSGCRPADDVEPRAPSRPPTITKEASVIGHVPRLKRHPANRILLPARCVCA